MQIPFRAVFNFVFFVLPLCLGFLSYFLAVLVCVKWKANNAVTRFFTEMRETGCAGIALFSLGTLFWIIAGTWIICFRIEW